VHYRGREGTCGALREGERDLPIARPSGLSGNMIYHRYLVSAWKSGLKTAKRPQPDRTKTAKRPDRSPVFWFLRSRDRKKTGLNEPVLSVRTGLL